MVTDNGGGIIAERLAKHGVTALFTLCGGHISPILVGAKRRGIRVVDVRDEVSAVFAADAMARTTGIPGVAAVTAGPGVTNTVTAVKNAQMAHTPLLIFGGATATILKGRGSLQDIDQLAIMKPITKWATRVTTLSALGPIVDRALEVATQGVPGPVFLEIPVDLLYPEEVVRDWYLKETGVEKMKGVGATALSLYLKGHLAHQFSSPVALVDGVVVGGPVSVDLNPKRARLKRPLAPLLELRAKRVAAAVARARKPVLVIGAQALVNMNPEQAEELANQVTRLGVPTFLGGAARGLLGQHSELQFRHKRSAALKQADLVIVAGFPFDFRLGYGRSINRRATLVSANLEASALTKNRRPDYALEMHPGRFLIELSRRVESRHDWTEWFEQLRGREAERDAEITAQCAAVSEERVGPLRLFARLEEKMAKDAVMIVDGGDFVAAGSYVVRPRAPLAWLDPGVFGTLGVGGGFAVGAAVARADRQVWLFYGDGSCGYSLAEFDTCVRHGLNPIAVIGTDASWAQIARDQIEILGDDVGTPLLRTAYHTVVEGYGGVGLLLEREEDIDAVLDEAIAAAASGKPVCINVHLAGSDFRKGSISI